MTIEEAMKRCPKYSAIYRSKYPNFIFWKSLHEFGKDFIHRMKNRPNDLDATDWEIIDTNSNIHEEE